MISRMKQVYAVFGGIVAGRYGAVKSHVLSRRDSRSRPVNRKTAP